MELVPPAARQGPGPLPADAVQRLELALRRRIGGLLPGEHLAPGAADGTELAQLRPYVAGDDVRRLDPAASARTGVPHVRRQVPERAVTTWIVLDVSPSMAFGSAVRLKSDVAAGVVDVVARMGVRHGGRVSLTLAGDAAPVTLRPGGGRGALGAIHDAVERGVLPDGTAGGVAPALERVGRLARSRGVVVVVSDFRDPGWKPPLAVLGARHAVIAVEPVDPLEGELPDAGLLAFADPETGELVDVDTGDRAVREAYAEEERARRAGVAADLRRCGARHVTVTTAGDWLRELGRGLRP